MMETTIINSVSNYPMQLLLKIDDEQWNKPDC